MNFDDPAEVERVAFLYDSVPCEWNPDHKVEPAMVENLARGLVEKRANTWCELVVDKNEIRATHVLEFRPERGGFVLIRTLWVHPELRRQGIARRLKQAGEEWARGRGAKAIVTQVHVTNKRMNALNEAMGFEATKIEYEKKI